MRKSPRRSTQRFVGALLISLLKENICGESPAILGGYFVKAFDQIFCLIYVLQNSAFEKTLFRIIIRKVSIKLHANKFISKILYGRWKFFHRFFGVYVVFCITMFQSSIDLLPRFPTAVGICAANQQIGAALSDAMEQSIISRTNGAPKIGLPRFTAFALN